MKSNFIVLKKKNTFIFKVFSKQAFTNCVFSFVFFFAPQIPPTMMNHVENISDQIRVSKSDVCALLRNLHETMADRDFIKQLLTINGHINAMSADN